MTLKLNKHELILIYLLILDFNKKNILDAKVELLKRKILKYIKNKKIEF